MNWDVLLHWMTHVGEGSWATFRNAVARLAGDDADVDYWCRTLRVVMSDLGHVDFFVDDSRRWRVRAPVLGGLPPPQGVAALAGGRTPKLSATLSEAVTARACRLVEDCVAEGLPSFKVEGPRQWLAAAAADAAIPYIEDFVGALCQEIVPIPLHIQRARAETAPGNWSVRSFDFRTLTWVDGIRPRSACEFRSRYGERRFYVHTRRGELLRLPKRQAVYAAAMISEVVLSEYELASSTLFAPTSAPLPEAYCRAACMCSGSPAQIDRGRFVFKNVPFDVAAFLLLAAGQPGPAHPRVRLASEESVHGQPI
ncbi:MAG: hypothetical protein HY700_17200 [Gemmatimonadetes bacterium]|nr:hypothetical protein [Gemmatimonadota bacterium]